jgi:hypothetical protein
MLFHNTNLNEKNYCFICIIRPILFLSSFHFSAARAFCPHSKPPSRFYFKKSSLLFKTPIISVSFLLLMGFYFAASCLHNDTLELHNILTLLMICVMNSVMILMIIFMEWRANGVIKHIRGIVFILEDCHSFGIDGFVDQKFKTRIDSLILFYILPSFIATGFVMSMLNFKLYNLELALETFCILVLVLINFSNALLVYLYVEIYTTLFERCYIQVERILSARIRNSDNKRFCPFSFKITLKKKLQKLQILHLRICQNFKVFARASQNAFLMWWAAFCVIFIGNAFLLIKCVQEYRSLSNREAMSLILCFSGILSSVLVTCKCQKLTDVVRKIILNSSSLPQIKNSGKCLIKI